MRKRRSLAAPRREDNASWREATARYGLRRGWQINDHFGASEVTIFSKRGSPRSGSQNGSSFKAP